MFFWYAGLLGKNTDGHRGNAFMQFLGYEGDETYDWDQLSGTQKEDLIDFGLTLSIFFAMLAGYNYMWEPDEEDTFKKLYGRLMNDIAGYVNPMEIMKNVVNLTQPISARKALKLSQSTIELMYSGLLYGTGFDDEAFTKQGRLRGWTEFSRNIHFLSAYHDIHKALEESPEALQRMLDYKYK